MRVDKNIGVDQMSLVGFALRDSEGFADVVETRYSQSTEGN